MNLEYFVSICYFIIKSLSENPLSNIDIENFKIKINEKNSEITYRDIIKKSIELKEEIRNKYNTQQNSFNYLLNYNLALNFNFDVLNISAKLMKNNLNTIRSNYNYNEDNNNNHNNQFNLLNNSLLNNLNIRYVQSNNNNNDNSYSNNNNNNRKNKSYYNNTNNNFSNGYGNGFAYSKGNFNFNFNVNGNSNNNNSNNNYNLKSNDMSNMNNLNNTLLGSYNFADFKKENNRDKEDFEISSSNNNNFLKSYGDSQLINFLHFNENNNKNNNNNHNIENKEIKNLYSMENMKENQINYLKSTIDIEKDKEKERTLDNLFYGLLKTESYKILGITLQDNLITFNNFINIEIERIDNLFSEIKSDRIAYDNLKNAIEGKFNQEKYSNINISISEKLNGISNGNFNEYDNENENENEYDINKSTRKSKSKNKNKIKFNNLMDEEILKLKSKENFVMNFKRLFDKIYDLIQELISFIEFNQNQNDLERKKYAVQQKIYNINNQISEYNKYFNIKNDGDIDFNFSLRGRSFDFNNSYSSSFRNYNSIYSERDRVMNNTFSNNYNYNNNFKNEFQNIRGGLSGYEVFFKNQKSEDIFKGNYT
jgi:hypothetical protein